MAYLTKQETQKLLGRSLTTAENTAFDEWEAIAEIRLADMLCVADIQTLLTTLGLTQIPADLKLVLARFFGGIATENGVEVGVTNKKVEDFSISYNDKHDNVFDGIVTANGATILKYSQCKIRSGRTLKCEAKYYHYDRF